MLHSSHNLVVIPASRQVGRKLSSHSTSPPNKSLPYSHRRSSWHSSRLHDFSITILRCSKDVILNSSFTCTARLRNFFVCRIYIPLIFLCFLFQFKRSFSSLDIQNLEFYNLKFHDIKPKYETRNKSSRTTWEVKTVW